MKKIFDSCKLMATIAILGCLVSCNPEESPLADKVTGSYSGYTLASCNYFSNTCTGAEALNITANEDGTVNIDFVSGSWGTVKVEAATVASSGSAYSVSGDGTATMGHAGASSDYACTVSGTVRSTSDAELTFSVPAVMGGLNIVFKTGPAPAELLLPGSYECYSTGTCNYFQDQVFDTEGAFTIAANDNGKLVLSYTSESWGSYEAEIEVTRTDDIYSFTGSGTVAIRMGPTTNDYEYSLSGHIDVTKSDYQVTCTLAGVMGGLTINLLPGTAPEAAE